jgi:hypothetical protein
MDETEVIYGTIGMLPAEEFDPDKTYDILNLVSFDGSSYVVHTKPPAGTLPTDLDYWQVSAQGTGKATASSVGTVKPDGTTTEVSTDGSMSVKTALQDALGLVKGSNGIKVGADGSIDVNTLFTQATELANIIAGEAIATALGKISKSIAVTMGLNENALLKSMLTNMDVNDSTKVNSAAYVHKLAERIGMGDELTIGANLTAGLNALNSNLTNVINNHGNAFPRGDRLHLQVNGNIGFTEILKNSNSTVDYGTIIANYMQDGSITEIVLSDTGLIAVKVDSGGNIISNKPIVTF